QRNFGFTDLGLWSRLRQNRGVAALKGNGQKANRAVQAHLPAPRGRCQSRRSRLFAALFLLCAVVPLRPLAADEVPALMVVEASQPAPIKLSLDAIRAM